jgi:PAS domain S-box-containing protein
MSHTMQRKTVLLLGLSLSLVAALVAIIVDEQVRDQLGPAYWIVALAIVGCVLLVLAGYAWDHTLQKRLRALQAAAEKQHSVEKIPDLQGDDSDEIMDLARNIERMAQSLQKMEASYRGIVEDQTDLVCRYRGDGKLIFVNGAYARFFGCRRQELVGQVFPLFQLGLASQGRMVGDPADALNFEGALESPTGAKLWFLWTQRAIRNATGDLLEYQAVGHDVSLRREADAALRRAKEAAETADRAKSEFLAIVSHELRTPIHGVKGFVDLLGETLLNHEQREHLAMIRAGAQTLESLITDILDLSKMEAGKLSVDRQPFSPHKCVEDVCAFFSQKAAAAAIKLEARIDPDVPAIINGDQVRLRQVLSNLIDNGLRFTERGSVNVHLGCSKTDPPPGSDRAAVRLLFTVADTGIGIPDEKIGQLFQPFSQVDASPTRRRDGTGLGLIICKRLCELMGGAISVESRAGEGSTFRFSIHADYEKRDTSTPFGSTAPLTARI